MTMEIAFLEWILLAVSAGMIFFSIYVYRAERRAAFEKEEKPTPMRAQLVMKDEKHGVMRFRLENGEYCDMHVWNMEKYKSLSLGVKGWITKGRWGVIHFKYF